MIYFLASCLSLISLHLLQVISLRFMSLKAYLQQSNELEVILDSHIEDETLRLIKRVVKVTLLLNVRGRIRIQACE